jgi:Na+-translocating ferredoxin:NAD+ oxidoreductase RnfG subunit
MRSIKLLLSVFASIAAGTIFAINQGSKSKISRSTKKQLRKSYKN